MMRSNSRRHASWAALVATMLVACAAEAAPADAKAEAQRLYVEGKALRSEGKTDLALDRFRRSHDLAPTPVTRLELARMLAGLGKLVEARSLAASVATLEVSPTETEKGRTARRDAASLASELEPRVPRVLLRVEPPGAGQILLDGAPVSQELLGTEQPLDPGLHIAVLREGERSVERSFTLAERERQVVELTLPPLPPPPAPAPTPPPVQPPAPAPKREAAPPPPVDEGGVSPAVPVAFTIGGISLVTGIVTGSIALAQAGTLKAECPGGQCPPGQYDLLGAHQAVATTSTVAFVIAGAAAAVGVVVLLVDGGDEAPRAARLQGRFTGTGVALEGAWF